MSDRPTSKTRAGAFHRVRTSRRQLFGFRWVSCSASEAHSKGHELSRLVPKVDIPHHLTVLRTMLIDWLLQRHLLLIGNQGVGKNKLADRFLSMLRLEREYLQLHRDTTVQSLTTQPLLQNGVVVYQDSPLVSAVRHGRVLVIDEADKAPLEVVCILKSLAEDGEFTLGDGRTIMASERIPEPPSQLHEQPILPISPSFRMIVLANRPGYPFLGNDFYRECGDVFATHAVDNPDITSEVELLRSYGPSVPQAGRLTNSCMNRPCSQSTFCLEMTHDVALLLAGGGVSKSILPE